MRRAFVIRVIRVRTDKLDENSDDDFEPRTDIGCGAGKLSSKLTEIENDPVPLAVSARLSRCLGVADAGYCPEAVSDKKPAAQSSQGCWAV